MVCAHTSIQRPQVIAYVVYGMKQHLFKVTTSGLGQKSPSPPPLHLNEQLYYSIENLSFTAAIRFLAVPGPSVRPLATVVAARCL